MGAEEGPGGADVIPEPPPPEVLVTRTGSTLGMGLPSLVCSFTTWRAGEEGRVRLL